MGVITDLVRMKGEQDTKAKTGQIDALKIAMMGAPTDEAREWAQTSLAQLLTGEFGGKTKSSGGGNSSGGSGSKGSSGSSGTGGKDGFFHSLLGGMGKMNPYTASQGTKQGIQQINQSRPQKMQLTSEEQEQLKIKNLQIENQEKQKQAVALAEQLAKQKRTDNQAVYEQNYDRLTKSGMDPKRAAEEANAIASNRAVPAAEKPSLVPKPPATPKDTPQSLAFQAYADSKGKKVEELTAADKIAAIKAEKEETRLTPAGKKATGTGGGTGGGTGVASSGSSPAKGGSKFDISAKPGLDLMAWEFINTGHTGQVGGGKEAASDRKEAIGRAGEILKWLGIPPQDLPSLRGALKANGQALSKVTTTGALTNQFESTVEKNMKTAIALSSRFSRTDAPFANRVASAWNTGTGGTEALNFVAQMHGLASEWAKVMQGSTSAAGATVSSVADAERIMSPYLSKGQIDSLFKEVILPDMKNRTEAINEEKSKLVDSLKGPQGPKDPATGEGGGGRGGEHGDSTSKLPKPDKPGKRISVDQAGMYLKEFKGDKTKAMEAAKKDGWVF